MDRKFADIWILFKIHYIQPIMMKSTEFSFELY